VKKTQQNIWEANGWTDGFSGVFLACHSSPEEVA
jgi:hypothetical protein